jgi:protein-S-isoprenylcysteine O-methyltransferase Ste14
MIEIKYPINLHKGLTFAVVFSLMVIYNNYSTAAWIYLALHGSYGFMWLLKDRIYPDKQWEEEISIGMAIGIFILLGTYWIAPFLLISSGIEVVITIIALAVSINLFGTLLHFTSDAQKYFTLKYRPGLITEGFFARCRNTNYLGEILIYLSFALLSQHWLPFLILGAFVGFVFVPNMLKKDRSLSRYPEFEEYQTKSGLILPKLISIGEIRSKNTLL